MIRKRKGYIWGIYVRFRGEDFSWRLIDILTTKRHDGETVRIEYRFKAGSNLRSVVEPDNHALDCATID